MDIQDELNEQMQTGEGNRPSAGTGSTLAALLVLVGALIVAPWVQQNHQHIGQAATQVTHNGRTLLNQITKKLPWRSERKG